MPGPAIPARIGRYQILCVLGRGGVGVVYLGRSIGPGGFERLAAIKMLHDSLLEPRFIRRFLAEARVAARLHHPNVVSVYEVDEEDGRYYIAMDYVNGEPLSLLLNRRWRSKQGLDQRVSAYLISVAAEALHAAHELRDPAGRHLGVVHRDISPHNILIGYEGIPRLTDFGLVKAADTLGDTRPGVLSGKAAYLSPEQIENKTIDRRADIFALGVVLWEATVGRRLFRASNDFATIERVRRMRVPAPSALIPGYPRELERIVCRALARRRDERYQTARALAEDLHSFLSSTGRLPSIGDIEALMKSELADRYERRLEILRRATAFDELAIEADANKTERASAVELKPAPARADTEPPASAPASGSTSTPASTDADAIAQLAEALRGGSGDVELEDLSDPPELSTPEDSGKESGPRVPDAAVAGSLAGDERSKPVSRARVIGAAAAIALLGTLAVGAVLLRRPAGDPAPAEPVELWREPPRTEPAPSAAAPPVAAPPVAAPPVAAPTVVPPAVAAPAVAATGTALAPPPVVTPPRKTSTVAKPAPQRKRTPAIVDGVPIVEEY